MTIKRGLSPFSKTSAKIEESISDYLVFGGKSVVEAMNAVIGTIATEPEKYQQSKDNPEGKKMWNVFGHLITLAKIGVNVEKIASGFKKLLE